MVSFSGALKYAGGAERLLGRLSEAAPSFDTDFVEMSCNATEGAVEAGAFGNSNGAGVCDLGRDEANVRSSDNCGASTSAVMGAGNMAGSVVLCFANVKGALRIPVGRCMGSKE